MTQVRREFVTATPTAQEAELTALLAKVYRVGGLPAVQRAWVYAIEEAIDQERNRHAKIADDVALNEAQTMRRTAREIAILIRDRILQTEFEAFNTSQKGNTDG